jgi:hypothetical protein
LRDAGGPAASPVPGDGRRQRADADAASTHDVVLGAGRCRAGAEADTWKRFEDAPRLHAGMHGALQTKPHMHQCPVCSAFGCLLARTESPAQSFFWHLAYPLSSDSAPHWRARTGKEHLASASRRDKDFEPDPCPARPWLDKASSRRGEPLPEGDRGPATGVGRSSPHSFRSCRHLWSLAKRRRALACRCPLIPTARPRPPTVYD